MFIHLATVLLATAAEASDHVGLATEQNSSGRTSRRDGADPHQPQHFLRGNETEGFRGDRTFTSNNNNQQQLPSAAIFPAASSPAAAIARPPPPPSTAAAAATTPAVAMAATAAAIHGGQTAVAGVHGRGFPTTAVRESRGADDDGDDDSTEKDAASKELAAKATAWCEDSKGARQKYGDIEEWDVSGVTSFQDLFRADKFGGNPACSTFNADLNSWNTSRVVDMSQMFYQADAFNGNIRSWDTSDVEDMSQMFNGADIFNGNLNSWDTSAVDNLSNMFRDADTFNGTIGAWNTSRVVDMSAMFYQADAFNGNLSAWDTSNVKAMSYMFSSTAAFNGHLNSWDISSVEDMKGMFRDTVAFNGNLNSWDTSNVKDMNAMFYHATAFNQDLGRWRFKLDSLSNMQYNIGSMFKSSKSKCKFEAPGFYNQTEDRTPTARLYCNGPNMRKDGAKCTADNQCDTGSCSISKMCLGYAAADANCLAANNSGGCFAAPTTTQSWFTSTAASLKDYFPEQMVGSGNESRVISWNRLNGQPLFQSTEILTKGDGSTLHTRLTYKLQWLSNATAFKVGQTPASANSSVWDPNNGPGGVGIDCSSGDIFATPNITGTYTAWLIAVDNAGPAKKAGLPAEFDEVLIKEWKLTVTKPTPFTINPQSMSRNRTARPGVRPGSFQKKEAGTLHTVGETYSYAPISLNVSGIEGNQSDSENNWKITYTLVDQPNGLLIDPADGFIQGELTTEGPFTMKVYAIDGSGTRSAHPLQNITFEVRNGPNTKPCSNGGYLVALDKSHTPYCNCEGTGFEGDNCETPKAIHTAVEAGASVASMLLLVTIAYMYRVRHLRLRAQVDALARARKAYGLSNIEPTTRGGMSVNSGDLVGVTINPSFVGLDVGYNNDLLTYEDDLHEDHDDVDPNGDSSAGIQDSLPSLPTTEKKNRRNQLSKFVAPTISLGKSTLAAKGLDVLLGIDPKTYMHVKQKQKVKVMLKEFAKNGTDEDNKNLKTLIEGTYVNPPNGDGSPLTPEEIIGQSRTIEELMEYSDVQDAGLERHHVLALRLYTTSTYSSINNPMRQSPPVLPHPFAATLYYISDALSKLREVQGKDPALRNETLVFWRGMKNLQITEEFIRTGGSEMACMSTTSSRQVAQDFALSKSPLLFKFMSKSFMSHGADIGFLSVYPGEKEVLYPPLTYLRPIKVSEETIGTTVYKVVEVEPVFPK